MLIYPQLASGASTQFPIVRRRSARTILNAIADGSSVKLADAAAGGTCWQLEYSGLSDPEKNALEQFFAAAEGSLNPFTFVDPAANLFAWSEALTNSAWLPDPLVQIKAGIDDPMGGANAWRLTNTGAGPQAIHQTLDAPGGYTYAFSVYVRGPQGSGVNLTLADARASFHASPTWTRVYTAAQGDAASASVAFGIEVPAGSAIDIFGPQAEAQSAPSKYRKSTRGGVYSGARLQDDSLSITTEDVNRHSATVKVFYADHL